MTQLQMMSDHSSQQKDGVYTYERERGRERERERERGGGKEKERERTRGRREEEGEGEKKREMSYVPRSAPITLTSSCLASDHTGCPSDFNTGTYGYV